MIHDHELLYRRIPACTHFFSVLDGRLRLTKAAFSDATHQPSVDRAVLLNYFPVRALTRPDQGIVCLTAGEVRAVQDVASQDRVTGNELFYGIDVIAAPSRHNNAHALITSAPALPSERPFLRLKERLARIAELRGWVLAPSAERVC